MSRQAKSKKEPRERDPPQAISAASKRRSRWLLILTVVTGLAVGAAIIERVTRPSGSTISGGGAAPAQSASQGGALVPPPPVQPTNEELVADANQLADELAESFPDDADALTLSGRVSFTLGSAAKAKDRWEQSVKLDPKSAGAWLGMAELTRQQGDFQEAVECMHRMAEADPDRARERVFVLADCLLKLGKAREAVDVLEQVGKIAPLPGWAQVMLGQGYYQLKDYERSAEHYRKALDDQQQASVAHYELSLALLRLGRQDEAQKHREEYARLQEKNMVVFDRMHRYGTQEERQSPAELCPIMARFYLEAGRLYAIRGQREQAEKHWLRAWALAPDRPEPRQLVESLYLQ